MTAWTGTWRLAVLALRRDRVKLPAWIVGLGIFVAATTAMFNQSLAAQADLVRETRLVATNAGMRMIGLTAGPSVGGYMLHREFVTLSVLAALMSALAVVRHTRQNEELGRAEMLGATVVGRSAPLAAAVIVAVLANVLLAVTLGLGIWVTGQTAAGSFLAGASVAGVGLVFVGVAAVACQLAATTRGAVGTSAALLGLAFLVSGVGNMIGSVDAAGLRVASAWPVWLSPMGWGQQTRPFEPDARWWPLVLCLGLMGVVLALALVLVGHRDLGRGMLPERRGHSHATATLLSPAGLVWRQQRGVLAGWAVGMLAFGLIFGSLTEQIKDIKGPAADFYTEMSGADEIVEGFRASMLGMAGMFIAIYAVQVLLRLRSEEASGTAESVLAAAVPRSRLVLAHVLNAAIGALLLVELFAVSMALATGAVTGDPTSQVRELAPAALVQLPAILALAMAVVTLVGLLPRAAVALSWTVLVTTFVIGPMFGPGLGLPRWVQDLSPFTHVPMLPAAELTLTPLAVLSLVAVTLAATGTLALRHRDLVLPA